MGFDIGAIASVGGSVLQGIGSYIGQKETNKANARMANTQMDFQERLSNTAHQREAKDLEKAGLNRILSLGGQGASSPSGAMAQMGDPIGAGISSAMANRQLQKEIKVADTQAGLNQAQEKLSTANEKVAQATKEATVNSAQKSATENKILKQELKAVKEESKFRQEKAKTDEKTYKAEKATSMIGNFINTIIGGTAKGIRNLWSPQQN